MSLNQHQQGSDPSGVDAGEHPDGIALAGSGQPAQPQHALDRPRTRIFPAATILEINYIRDCIQRRHAVLTAAERVSLLTGHGDRSLEANSEQQRHNFHSQDVHLDSSVDSWPYHPSRSSIGLDNSSDCGCESDGSFPVASRSSQEEHDAQVDDVPGHSAIFNFEPLPETEPDLQSDDEDSFVLVSDRDSDVFAWIPTPPEYDNMDEDYLEENGEAHAAHQHANNYDHEDDFVVPSDDEDEDMEESDVEGDFAESDGEAVEEDELDPDAPPAVPFNPVAMGLKEIGGLARFRVSSYKPGNGVDELVNDDTDRYWQSDGIQPHRLTMTFVKRVEIRALRFYVDYTQDESYTPTRINWFAGTSEHDLHAFGTSNLVNPSGWIDVPLTGAGGGEDGNSLFAWVVQMQIIENHQNGKDTHIRGVKVYGFDDQLRAAGATGLGARDDVNKDFRVDEAKGAEENEKALRDHLRALEFTRSFQDGDPSGTASSLEFMEDPVIR